MSAPSCHQDRPYYAVGMCKSCHQRVWASRNRASVQRSKRKQEYGLSDADYQTMLVAQGGMCAICGEAMTPPCVDHDHDSGRVRGLLCGFCNRALGNFRDDLTVLAAAIRYLEESR